MANAAYPTEESDLPVESRRTSDSRPVCAGATGNPERGADGPVPDVRSADIYGGSDLKKAAGCEKSAQALSSRISKMEDSIYMVRIFLGASGAVEELLVQSRCMLEKGRQLSGPQNRNALAQTFAAIRKNIDDIVAQAIFRDRTLVAGEIAGGAFDGDENRTFRIDPLTLTTGALELSEFSSDLKTDAEIIDATIRIDHAIDTVRTRRAIAETALSVLLTRVKIARERVLYLRDASRSLMNQDTAYDEICAYSERRLVREPIDPANQNHRDAPKEIHASDGTTQQLTRKIPEDRDVKDGDIELPRGAQSQNEGAALSTIQDRIDDLDISGEIEELDGLTKELSRALGIESYLTHWFKYEDGDTGIFTRILAQSFGPELNEKAAREYKDNNDFKALTDRYMTMFEALIRQNVDKPAEQKAVIDKILKTDQGAIYAMLAKACGRV